MKNRIIKTAGTLLLAAGLATGIQAQARMHHPALDLSEEQQEQMQALRLDHYKAMKPLKNQMAELKARENTLISEDDVDIDAVNTVIDEQTALQNKMRKLGVVHRLSIRQVLTDEQLMKADQRRQIAKARHGHGKQFNGTQNQGRHGQARPCHRGPCQEGTHQGRGPMKNID